MRQNAGDTTLLSSGRGNSPRDADGVLASLTDVTDRDETLERIKRSEGRFRAAVGAIQGYLWTNSAAGEMVGNQEGWHALTGQNESEYQGFGWATAVHSDDAAATIEAWNAAVATRSIFSHEHRVRCADGQWRDFSIRAVPILDDSGGIIEWVGIHTDITEQRAAKAELLAFNAELEDRVSAEVAARLAAEKAMRQSQKMDALGQLTGGIAHDFNNMLSVMTSAFTLLERRLAGSDAATLKLIEAGQHAAVRAARLTDRMLAFARQEPEKPEPIDVNEAIINLGQLFAHSLGADIKVEYQFREGLGTTVVDRNQFDNAILNLAVNARDALKGNGRIVIETQIVTLVPTEQSDGLSGDFIQISVSDNGAGIPIEVQKRVFEPFFTTKPAGLGTGLGLSQVYGFVRKANGNVTISSELGEGTRVTIYLPRAT